MIAFTEENKSLLNNGLTHPTIHTDYYEWLKEISTKEFERTFINKHSRDFQEFNAVAMWAWSQSREKLKQKLN